MPNSTSWVGTDLELLDFLNAVGRHCACADPASAACGAHGLVRADQATISRLVFARRIAGRLRREEWQGQPRLTAADRQPHQIADLHR
jgi:hypothetical protein